MVQSFTCSRLILTWFSCFLHVFQKNIINFYVGNAILLRQEITILSCSKRLKTNDKNTISTVQITAMREHTKKRSLIVRIVLISQGNNQDLGTANASASAARKARHRVLIYLRPPPSIHSSVGMLKAATASTKMVCLFFSTSFLLPLMYSCSSSSPSSW